jgi:hypothetical protein
MRLAGDRSSVLPESGAPLVGDHEASPGAVTPSVTSVSYGWTYIPIFQATLIPWPMREVTSMGIGAILLVCCILLSTAALPVWPFNPD